MALTIHPDASPLRIDENGVARIGNTQVLLDVVVRGFNDGAAPEAIAHGYSTLDLSDVYGVIGYYLRHRGEIDEYLETRRQQAAELRQEIEAKQPAGVATSRPTARSQAANGTRTCFVSSVTKRTKLKTRSGTSPSERGRLRKTPSAFAAAQPSSAAPQSPRLPGVRSPAVL